MSEVICHNCGSRYDCGLHEEQGLCRYCATGLCYSCVDKKLHGECDETVDDTTYNSV